MTTPQSNHPFAGLRVALTGGTSGLGLALLRALREHGADVAFVARDAERVARVAAAHPGSRGIAGDVSDKQQTHGLALQLASAFGGVDLLIHNAAALGPVATPLADTECEELGAVLDTNLMGPFRLTKALLGSLSGPAADRCRTGGSRAARGREWSSAPPRNRPLPGAGPAPGTPRTARGSARVPSSRPTAWAGRPRRRRAVPGCCTLR